MSHANRDRREERIVTETACPACGSPAGQRCREGVAAHDQRRGVEDLRPFLNRVHSGRRAAWTAAKGLDATHGA